MTMFDRLTNCYFCEKKITKKTKSHNLGAEGDNKTQCHTCYNRAAKIRCKKPKLRKRYF